jgi:hypothetical protein
VTDEGHIGPRVTPTWWDFARQLVIFLLGVGVICYAVVTSGYDVPFLITGLVLIGIVPVDRYVVTRANEPPTMPATYTPEPTIPPDGD